jgi:hypothetical protein
MKRIAVIFAGLFLVTLVSGCKSTITLSKALDRKEVIDKTENPARKYLLKNELGETRVELENVLVKEIIRSNNIDYDFCVLVDVETPKGPVECYIYTKNVRTLSRLKEGESRIDAIGDFGRFFTMLDDYYTKVEILKAKVSFHDESKKKNGK